MFLFRTREKCAINFAIVADGSDRQNQSHPKSHHCRRYVRCGNPSIVHWSQLFCGRQNCIAWGVGLTIINSFRWGSKKGECSLDKHLHISYGWTLIISFEAIEILMKQNCGWTLTKKSWSYFDRLIRPSGLHGWLNFRLNKEWIKIYDEKYSWNSFQNLGRMQIQDNLNLQRRDVLHRS
jgi:hypothetical protein